jgi:hypothetical protein
MIPETTLRETGAHRGAGRFIYVVRLRLLLLTVDSRPVRWGMLLIDLCCQRRRQRRLLSASPLRTTPSSSLALFSSWPEGLEAAATGTHVPSIDGAAS